MPLMPFHLGPASFLGLLLFRLIHLPTFLVANIVVDLEPFLILLFGLNYPLHGFFHSFLGGSITAIVLSIAMIWLDKWVQGLMSAFRLGQKHSRKSILLASFSGIYLHIVLDSLLYTDIRPLFPLAVNPFYISSASTFSAVYGLCLISFILAGGLCLHKIAK